VCECSLWSTIALYHVLMLLIKCKFLLYDQPCSLFVRLVQPRSREGRQTHSVSDKKNDVLCFIRVQVFVKFLRFWNVSSTQSLPVLCPWKKKKCKRVKKSFWNEIKFKKMFVRLTPKVQTSIPLGLNFIKKISAEI